MNYCSFTTCSFSDFLFQLDKQKMLKMASYSLCTELLDAERFKHLQRETVAQVNIFSVCKNQLR